MHCRRSRWAATHDFSNIAADPLKRATADTCDLPPGPLKEVQMRYLVIPVILVLVLFYLADQYFTHGAYYAAFQYAIRSLF
jgi:hypothetical protein